MKKVVKNEKMKRRRKKGVGYLCIALDVVLLFLLLKKRFGEDEVGGMGEKLSKLLLFFFKSTNHRTGFFCTSRCQKKNKVVVGGNLIVCFAFLFAKKIKKKPIFDGGRVVFETVPLCLLFLHFPHCGNF